MQKNSDTEPRTVESFAGNSNRGQFLSNVFDSQTNQYFAPALDRDRLGLGKGIVTAILDSGVLLTHPLIARNVIHSVDFTGEGTNDLNGHGTMVALLAINQLPEADFINVKILDAEARGHERNFIKGFDWCIENRDKYRIMTIILSAGVYHRKWGIFDCNGDCDLCKAAERATF